MLALSKQIMPLKKLKTQIFVLFSMVSTSSFTIPLPFFHMVSCTQALNQSRNILVQSLRLYVFVGNDCSMINVYVKL